MIDFLCLSGQFTGFVKLSSPKVDVQGSCSSVSGLVLSFFPQPEQKRSSGSTFSPQLLQYIFNNPGVLYTVLEKLKH